MLHGLDLGDAKFGRLLADVVDADDEHRPSVRLQLPRGRAHQHQRILLARDERGLPVAHHRLLLWIGWCETQSFRRLKRSRPTRRTAPRFPDYACD